MSDAHLGVRSQSRWSEIKTQHHGTPGFSTSLWAGIPLSAEIAAKRLETTKAARLSARRLCHSLSVCVFFCAYTHPVGLAIPATLQSPRAGPDGNSSYTLASLKPVSRQSLRISGAESNLR